MIPARPPAPRGPRRPAFYALRAGGWRDYWTLLHPPYTAWHLSYVVFGAVAAPEVDGPLLGVTLAAFFLGVGLAAHALDELSGRPLATTIPDPVLWGVAGVSLAGAVALGVFVAIQVSWWLLVFVAFGSFIVVAYNLESFGGRFHSDGWFAVAWGAFPALTSYFVQTATIRGEAALVALACMLLSAAQRRLSTPVRRLRRRAVAVEGRMVVEGGTQVPITEEALLSAPEAALRILALALPVLALGLALARLL